MSLSREEILDFVQNTCQDVLDIVFSCLVMKKSLFREHENSLEVSADSEHWELATNCLLNDEEFTRQIFAVCQLSTPEISVMCDEYVICSYVVNELMKQKDEDRLKTCRFITAVTLHLYKKLNTFNEKVKKESFIMLDDENAINIENNEGGGVLECEMTNGLRRQFDILKVYMPREELLLLEEKTQ